VEEKTMTEQYSEQRRNFLKTLAVLGGAAVSLAATHRNQVQPKLPVPKPQGSSLGYRETGHIRKYYETARG
jgi:hypothetical protein